MNNRHVTSLRTVQITCGCLQLTPLTVHSMTRKQLSSSEQNYAQYLPLSLTDVTKVFLCFTFDEASASCPVLQTVCSLYPGLAECDINLLAWLGGLKANKLHNMSVLV